MTGCTLKFVLACLNILVGRGALLVFCNMFGDVSFAGFIGVPKFVRPLWNLQLCLKATLLDRLSCPCGFCLAWRLCVDYLRLRLSVFTFMIVPLSPTILQSWLILSMLGLSGPNQLGFVRTLIKLLRLQKVFVNKKNLLISCLIPSLPQLVCLVSLCLALPFGAILTRRASRIEACLRTIRLIACIGMPFHRFMDAVRMFAISKLSYGWITRLPTWTTCKSIWSAIGRGSRRMRAASPFLKGVQIRELAWPAETGPATLRSS